MVADSDVFSSADSKKVQSEISASSKLQFLKVDRTIVDDRRSTFSKLQPVNSQPSILVPSRSHLRRSTFEKMHDRKRAPVKRDRSRLRSVRVSPSNVLKV